MFTFNAKYINKNDLTITVPENGNKATAVQAILDDLRANGQQSRFFEHLFESDVCGPSEEDIRSILLMIGRELSDEDITREHRQSHHDDLVHLTTDRFAIALESAGITLTEV